MRNYNKMMGVILGIMLGVPALAQNGTVDIQEKQKNRMKTTLDTKYKGVDHNNINWQMNDDEGYYEGTFDYNGRELTTRFDKNGNWMQTSETIAMDDLPVNMRTSLSNDYDPSEVSQINKIENNKNKSYYNVTVNGKEPMRFDTSGNPVERTDY